MAERPKRRKITEEKPSTSNAAVKRPDTKKIPEVKPAIPNAMLKRPDGTVYIQVKPPPTDAVPPYVEPRKEFQMNAIQRRRVMEALGRALYERRQKAKSRDPVILTALPKGYIVERGKGLKFRGHPSRVMFRSTSTFLVHLFWLEAMSHPKSIEPRRKCECILCKRARNKGQPLEAEASTGEESDASAPSSPVPSSASASMPSGESTPTPDNSKTILLHPLKKVLIERHVKPHYYYPDTFTIPLPSIRQSDKQILSKSLPSSSK